MSITSSIDRGAIPDVAKTILETDDGDTFALFTARSDFVPVGRTRLRVNGDESGQLDLPIEALRDLAEALTRHADHLDATRGTPAGGWS